MSDTDISQFCDSLYSYSTVDRSKDRKAIHSHSKDDVSTLACLFFIALLKSRVIDSEITTTEIGMFYEAWCDLLEDVLLGKHYDLSGSSVMTRVNRVLFAHGSKVQRSGSCWFLPTWDTVPDMVQPRFVHLFKHGGVQKSSEWMKRRSDNRLHCVPCVDDAVFESRVSAQKHVDMHRQLACCRLAFSESSDARRYLYTLLVNYPKDAFGDDDGYELLIQHRELLTMEGDDLFRRSAGLFEMKCQEYAVTGHLETHLLGMMMLMVEEFVGEVGTMRE